MTEGEPQTSQNAPSAALSSGSKVFGRYQIVRCISSGGMGAVYEVVHAETRRRCALKVMLPSIVSNPDLRARFQLEATITADIQSEHIVELFDAGVDGESGTPFIVMELLRGEDLQSMVFRRGCLPPAEVTLLLHQAAMALDRTHAAGIVHRDLKPENLFVTTRDDGSPRLKIFDFGIAKVVASSAHISKSTQGMGTPMFMAPEQRGGEGSIGPAADTYALGHIAYSLLVGEPYWEEEAEASPTVYAFLMKMAAGIVEPPGARARRRRDRALPPAFDAWLMKATAPLPSDRFQRATDLVIELARALDLPAPTAVAPPIAIAVQTSSHDAGDVSPHAATIATDPSVSLPAARESAPAVLERAKVSGPPAPDEARSIEALPKRRSSGALAAIVGVCVGLVVVAAGAWLTMKKPDSANEPSKQGVNTNAQSGVAGSGSPTMASPTANAPHEATRPAVTPAITSAEAQPALPTTTTGAPQVSASARAPRSPTEKLPAGKTSGKANTPPVDPLDVR